MPVKKEAPSTEKPRTTKKTATKPAAPMAAKSTTKTPANARVKKTPPKAAKPKAAVAPQSMTRDERIKAETKRLNGIFKDLDPNKKAAVKSLIENAAFMSIALEDLQEAITKQGYSDTYTNGSNQSGTKETPEVKTYLAMTKNHATAIKMLADLVPPAPKKNSRFGDMRKVAGGK